MARRPQRKLAAVTVGSASERPADLSAGGLSVVKLLEERLNAKGRPCAVGTVISPNVEGWPEHRVRWHIQHGYAEQVAIDRPIDAPALPQSASAEESPAAPANEVAERSVEVSESVDGETVMVDMQDDAAQDAEVVADAQSQE